MSTARYAYHLPIGSWRNDMRYCLQSEQQRRQTLIASIRYAAAADWHTNLGVGPERRAATYLTINY